MTTAQENGVPPSIARIRLDVLSPDVHAASRAIWTDASVWKGGSSWAWVDDSGYFAHGVCRGWATDNNDAELWAIAEGVRAAQPGQLVHVNTDSETAAALMQPFALVDGVVSKPMRDIGRYRESLDEIGSVANGKTVVVHWLKGHRSDVRNVAADALATAARWTDSTYDEWEHDCRHALRGFGARLGQRLAEGPLCSCGHLR
ncbi:RNase H family protein [Lacisediminihabitans changchengi]|uniref:RNase H type-1 domain-containing protein n=1 Tax=Lacisediminihabitans changchengi TaxID=2787634 RepID=A0A934W2R8_9MICO|nr:hypothetical protein [Lacisediminihabitans changchengi]